MDGAQSRPRRLTLRLLCLGVLLAACGLETQDVDSARNEADEAADLEVDSTADVATDKGARSRFRLGTYVRPPSLKVWFFLQGADLNRALDVVTHLRSTFLDMPKGCTLRFFLSDSVTAKTVSFELSVDLFLGGGAEGLPLVPTSLVPSSFRYGWTGSYALDPRWFEKELHALSGVTFDSFEAQITSDFDALQRDHSDVAQTPAVYRLLARLYYMLVVGPFSDAAQATMANERTLGDAAWAFVTGYLGWRAWARRERLIGAAAPLILTTATVASMAASFELPPELFQQIVGFLCGA